MVVLLIMINTTNAAFTISLFQLHLNTKKVNDMYKCFTHILINKIKIELTEKKTSHVYKYKKGFVSRVLTGLESISGNEPGTPWLGVQHSNYWDY